MSRLGRIVLAVLATITMAGALAGPAPAATTMATGPAAEQAPPPEPLRLTRAAAKRIALATPKITGWLRDHPITGTHVTPNRDEGSWTVDVRGPDGEVHTQVIVDDVAGTVREVRTGPQVAWQMARGYEGAFGRAITKKRIWLPLIAAFLLPLINWRRPVSWHTLDLLALCAFTLSLTWFNRGDIFTSVPLVYPPLAYLFGRMLVIGLRRPRSGASDDGSDEPSSTVPRLVSAFPTWLLVALLTFVMGIRLGLNAFDSNVIDVGYAGVIGADRIEHGVTPYGTFPADCSECDTYGPLTYLAYVPFERAMPWVGRWDDLPAAHGAAVAFDLLALAGLIVLGWRLGGNRLAAGLGLAWATYPFTAYALESNSNDSLVAAILAWGLVVAHRPAARTFALGLAAWAKFSPVILLGLWTRTPFPRSRGGRRWGRVVGGLAAATAVAAWPLLLDGADGVRRFWSRTLDYQLDRESPFSIWGLHPGLRPFQLALQVLVVLLALALVARPRRLDLRRFAALSGALILGVQLTMPHWFYLYIPWFLPFALLVLVPRWSTPGEARGPQAPVGAPGATPAAVGA